jgi:hypothetical protein
LLSFGDALTALGLLGARYFLSLLLSLMLEALELLLRTLLAVSFLGCSFSLEPYAPICLTLSAASFGIFILSFKRNIGVLEIDKDTNYIDGKFIKGNGTSDSQQIT